MPECSLEEYEEWERRVPDSITSDQLWKISAYRKALYLRREAWPDSVNLVRHRLGEPIARQLYRAVGSIAANVAEGWSRGTGPERARFFEYALGSTREAIVWYQAAAPILGVAPTKKRLSELAEVRRLVLVMIQTERRRRSRVTRKPEGAPDKSD